jgi:Fe2+ transport system protein B
MLDEEQLDSSLLAGFGSIIAWIFAPLGWGNWQAAVASITGLVAKENIVGTMGVLYSGGESTVWQTLADKFTSITGFSFLVFNLLCAPCFAAIGAIKREMNNAKWTIFAIAYQCGFAYAIALMITQLGGLFTGESNIIGVIAAVAILGFMVYMLFIKKAGTIILLSTIFVWFTSRFGFVDGSFRMLEEDQLDASILAKIGNGIAWIFKPLGWGNWQAAVASITGLVAKENIVGTMGTLYGGGDQTTWQALAGSFTAITGFSFLVFNLLCAPCFAAIGAIKREMNNAKWTWFAIAYQCGFAYCIALMITQFGNIFLSGATVNVVGIIAASLLLIGMIFMLFRPYKEATKLTVKNKKLALNTK